MMESGASHQAAIERYTTMSRLLDFYHGEATDAEGRFRVSQFPS